MNTLVSAGFYPIVVRLRRPAAALPNRRQAPAPPPAARLGSNRRNATSAGSRAITDRSNRRRRRSQARRHRYPRSRSKRPPTNSQSSAYSPWSIIVSPSVGNKITLNFESERSLPKCRSRSTISRGSPTTKSPPPSARPRLYLTARPHRRRRTGQDIHGNRKASRIARLTNSAHVEHQLVAHPTPTG